MTADQLSKHFDRIYGYSRPQTYEVDADTYANCCQFLFDQMKNKEDKIVPETAHMPKFLPFPIGPNSGIIFNKVELILQGYKK